MNRIRETTLAAPALDGASRSTAAPTVVLDIDKDDGVRAPSVSSNEGKFADVININNSAGEALEYRSLRRSG